MLQFKVTWRMRRVMLYSHLKRPCRFEGWYLFGFIPLWVVQKTYHEG